VKTDILFQARACENTDPGRSLEYRSYIIFENILIFWSHYCFSLLKAGAMKQPFKINVEQSILDDLKNRIVATRWTDEIENSKWEYGTSRVYLKELCDYWHDNFDWKKQEDYLNSFTHFKTIIDGAGLHFIHQKGDGNISVPLLLIHGFPDSFIRFLKIIPLLTKADKNGLSFNIIIPSIPGYGFSDIPTEPGMNPKRIAHLFTRLMTDELGYKKFVAHGGDWGTSITEQIALYHADSLLGIHLTDVPLAICLLSRKEN